MLPRMPRCRLPKDRGVRRRSEYDRRLMLVNSVLTKVAYSVMDSGEGRIVQDYG